MCAGHLVRAPRFEPPFCATRTTEWNGTQFAVSPTTDDTTSDTDPHRPRHVLIPVGRSGHATLRIHPRTYSKKYMRKRVYRYTRYYVEIPKRIAESSLGVEPEARSLRNAQSLPLPDAPISFRPSKSLPVKTAEPGRSVAIPV